jgi:hypothetical protein
MSDPPRLLDSGSPLARAVLAKASVEAAPDGLRPNIEAVVLASAAVAGATASSMASATTSAKLSSWVASLSLGKCVAVVTVGAVAVGGAHAVLGPVLAGSHPPVTVVVPTAPQRVVAREAPRVPPAPAPPETPRAVAPSNDVAPTRSLVPTPEKPVPAQARTSSEADDFAREVAGIDAARAALAESDLDVAIERLNRHDLDFPHGALRPEALALRIEVYVAKHDEARARELASAFVASYPNHPFAARIPGMLERTSR